MQKPNRNALQKNGPPGAGVRHEVRIVGGRWRGRRLHFPTGTTIRPTPDRVRETLFNWLQPMIVGARCLDAFAGSGALGFEALSRGAATAVLVENDRAVVRYLREVAALLGADSARIVEADALAFLGRPAEAFDLVFLDPPFTAGLMPALLGRLAKGGWLAPGAFVYLESPAAEGEPALPPGWTLHRSKRAGEVGYHLARVPAATGDAGQDEP